MDFSAALPTFIITLREGVEAALVVGIVLAMLAKANQSRLNAWVYAGVGAGIGLSAAIGAVFASIIQAAKLVNPQYANLVKPLMEGTFSVIAIAMLSWMLIWMTKQARFMKAEVEGAVQTVLRADSQAGWGVFTLVLIAVLREGVETVLFIASNFQEGLVPIIGAVAGILFAALIGALIFKWGVKINIRLFFQVMGIFLVLIVAGLVVGALRKFDQAFATLALSDSTWNLCFSSQISANHSCILGPMVWNTSNILPDKKFPGVILKVLFGYREHLYLVQAVAYVSFLLSVGGLYLRSITATSPQNKKKIPVS
ncbi:FTR1 family protein [Rivularia sp. UHCC 0363]|uniref:FTR1 family iron permease n=1 Tax=Rivularia sp. UHCC 0363 TaxID=3110244 RepID=UPI002B1EE5A5|nr:FTR1 family protein [Rivularia sp. UHCC 0363]MEA5597850.1 FTR1 family protein [Rivularia sp. UHCC 0363]